MYANNDNYVHYLIIMFIILFNFILVYIEFIYIYVFISPTPPQFAVTLSTSCTVLNRSCERKHPILFEFYMKCLWLADLKCCIFLDFQWIVSFIRLRKFLSISDILLSFTKDVFCILLNTPCISKRYLRIFSFNVLIDELINFLKSNDPSNLGEPLLDHNFKCSFEI